MGAGGRWHGAAIEPWNRASRASPPIPGKAGCCLPRGGVHSRPAGISPGINSLLANGASSSAGFRFPGCVYACLQPAKLPDINKAEAEGCRLLRPGDAGRPG